MCMWSGGESVLGGVCSVYVCVCPSIQGGLICLSVGPHSHLQSAVQCDGVPGPASEGL